MLRAYLKAHVVPPVDEVRLLADAAAWVQAHGAAWPDGTPDRAILQALTREVGIDLATAIFYQALLASPQHGPFVCEVGRLPAAPWAGEAGATLLVVPALYYQELPQYGGDGTAIAAIAQACGFRTATAPLLSKGSLSRNAELLAEALAGQPGPVVLLSLSVGGGEVRLLLDRWAGDRLLDKLAGWVNVCGLVRGIPLADRLLCNPIRRFHARAVCGAIGLDFDLVRELDPAHAAWQRPFCLPPRLPVINLIGAPLRCHVQQRSLFKRYGWMAALGPNDGMALLPDLLAPGPVYPVWGADHYFRTPQVSALFYRIFRYVRQHWLEGVVNA